MLKTMKSHMVKIRVCSIVGLLIRHATVIDNDVAKSGIRDLLIQTLSDQTNDQVRRKAIASLGEYLFYAATQLNDD
jgi:serine/threonine-protein kinase ULK4